MSDNEEEFQKVEGGSHTYPTEAGALKKGGHVLIKDRPCKIIEISFAKTGKHGHAKANITGTDIFTDKKYEESCPSSASMQCPVVAKKEYSLISVDNDGYCTLQDGDDFKTDLIIPTKSEQEWLPRFWTDYNANKTLVVTVMSAMGEEHIMGYREDKEK